MNTRNTKYKTRKLGFTLIELLVVISIIGILASLAMVSYSGAQKQARDSQRRSDLAQYRNGLENYATNHNSLYPVQTSPTIMDGTAGGFCDTNLEPDYISACPEDPVTVNDYKYVSGNIGGSFVIWANLETGYYWVICSTGQVGETADSTEPTTAACPI